MNSALFRSGLLAASVLVFFACTSDRNRGPGSGVDGGPIAIDGGSSGDGSTPTDGAFPGTDGALPGDDGAIPGTDAGPGGGGLCDPVCLAQPGSACCTACGCDGASIRCEPRCNTGERWDCELGCCFDTTSFMCVGE